jgi:transposase
MKVLSAFAAISACRFGDRRQSVLRQDDSVDGSLLPEAAESACLRAMTNAPTALPHDVDALHALIFAERAAYATAHAAVLAERNTIAAERDQLAARTEKLEYIVAEMRRARFGRSSERIDDDQLALALEALETEHAKTEAQAEKANPALKTERARQRRKSRTETLDHLPHEEVVIEPESKTCPCCNGALHKIGEDVSKRLDKVPAKLTVVVTRRPKLACRDCEQTGTDEVAGIIQAPAPARLIEGGLPTERLVADVVVSKFADHLPLYRQSQILARLGVRIERSTLAGWVGTAAAELQPLHDHLVGLLKASPKLFCDETRCPVLDPGRGKTKTGFMWALARDDRPWGGELPPAVAYTYAPGRGGVHAVKLLDGFSGDPRFWRVAPLASTGLGTSFSLQGLWAAPWLTDVAGLDRSAVVEHLVLMAAVLSATALLMGAVAERLRCFGIPTELFLAGMLALSMAAQLALLLGLPVPTHLLFGIIATGGATAVLSFAILARYFPKEVAGRANAALGVLNMGMAFGLQCLAGFIIAQWPAADGHYPAQAHEAAMAVGLGLQLIALGVFLAPSRRSKQMPMAFAVARVLGFDPSIAAAAMPLHYASALLAWRRHVADTRRQATAWRFAAVASMALCLGLAGSLFLALSAPAIALHLVQGGVPRMAAAEVP